MANHSRWSLPWGARPTEEAAHFNPAFCGELLARSVQDYSRLKHAPLPLPLAFIILPLSLHPSTRHALPRKANTTLISWSAANEAILATVPERVLQLRPVTREALLFLAQLDAIFIAEDGVLPGAKPLRLSARPPISTEDVDSMRRTAGFLGRWFAYQPAYGSILQTMGVRI